MEQWLGRNRPAWCLGIIALATTVWSAFVLDDARLLGVFVDDSYYYLQVASNVAAGRGFTFDGLHPTNGFQPLWLFVLVAVFSIVPGVFAPLRVVVVLQGLLVAGSCVLLWRALRERLPPAAAMLPPLLLLALPRSFFILSLGMEGSLYLFLLLLTWNLWLSIGEPGRGASSFKHWLGLGSCCALTFLARLEGGAATIALALLLVLGARRSPERRPRLAARLGLVLAPVALIAGIYLAWNSLVFGTFVPVSGMVKLRWAAELPWWDRFASFVDVPWLGSYVLEYIHGRSSEVVAARAAMLLIAVVLGYRYRSELRASVRSTGSSFLLLACGTHFLVSQLLLGRTFFGSHWQHVPIHLATALLGGLFMSRFRRLLPLLLAALIALCAVRTYRHADWVEVRFARGLSTGRLAAARWLDLHIPPDGRIGSFNAGALGYLTEHPVVSLDGLANDVEFYHRVLVGRDLVGYMRAEGIGWVADPLCGGETTPARHFESAGVGRFPCDVVPVRISAPLPPLICDVAVFRIDWATCP